MTFDRRGQFLLEKEVKNQGGGSDGARNYPKLACARIIHVLKKGRGVFHNEGLYILPSEGQKKREKLRGV